MYSKKKKIAFWGILLLCACMLAVLLYNKIPLEDFQADKQEITPPPTQERASAVSNPDTVRQGLFSEVSPEKDTITCIPTKSKTPATAPIKDFNQKRDHKEEALQTDTTEILFIAENTFPAITSEETLSIACDAEKGGDTTITPTEEVSLPETVKSLHKKTKGIAAIPRYLTPKKRMERGVKNHLFIPKGYFSMGLNVAYTQIENENYSLFNLFKKWDGSGQSLEITPNLSYFFWDNNSLGVQFIYQRTSLTIDNLTLNLGDDLNLSIEGLRHLQQIYSASFFHRSYIGLGENSRWGLFNETRLTLGGGDGYALDNKNQIFHRTKQDIFDLQVGIKPGLTFFISESSAFEVSLDVLGLKYRKIWQTDEQGKRGTHSTSGANFKINLFKINFGLSIFI